MVTETILDYVTFYHFGMKNSSGTLSSKFPCDSYPIRKHNMLTENLLSGSCEYVHTSNPTPTSIV